MSAIAGIISCLMVVDYIRVRKSNIKEVQELIEKRRSNKLAMITLISVSLFVLFVAVVGLWVSL